MRWNKWHVESVLDLVNYLILSNDTYVITEIWLYAL